MIKRRLAVALVAAALPGQDGTVRIQRDAGSPECR